MAEEEPRVATKAGSKETLTEFKAKLEKFSVGGESSAPPIKADAEKKCYDESKLAECNDYNDFKDIDRTRHEYLRKSENSMIRLAQEEFAKLVPKAKPSGNDLPPC